MSTGNIDPASKSKMLGNTIYHAAVTSGLGQMALGGQTTKFAFTGRDVGLVVLDVTAAMATKDWLIHQGIIPSNVLKM